MEQTAAGTIIYIEVCWYINHGKFSITICICNIYCTAVLHRWLFADMCVLPSPSVIMDKGHCARSLESA